MKIFPVSDPTSVTMSQVVVTVLACSSPGCYFRTQDDLEMEEHRNKKHSNQETKEKTER